jgi:hypothetical protein
MRTKLKLSSLLLITLFSSSLESPDNGLTQTRTLCHRHPCNVKKLMQKIRVLLKIFQIFPDVCSFLAQKRGNIRKNKGSFGIFVWAVLGGRFSCFLCLQLSGISGIVVKFF